MASTMRRVRVWGRHATVALAAAAYVYAGHAAFAQTFDTPRGTGGFQQNREYLALQPLESIDTASSNVILRFEDLVLPGNAGRQLRFERVFNNTAVSPTHTRWS